MVASSELNKWKNVESENPLTFRRRDENVNEQHVSISLIISLMQANFEVLATDVFEKDVLHGESAHND